jgi:hypothetical protein
MMEYQQLLDFDFERGVVEVLEVVDGLVVVVVVEG